MAPLSDFDIDTAAGATAGGATTAMIMFPPSSSASAAAVLPPPPPSLSTGAMMTSSSALPDSPCLVSCFTSRKLVEGDDSGSKSSSSSSNNCDDIRQDVTRSNISIDDDEYDHDYDSLPSAADTSVSTTSSASSAPQEDERTRRRKQQRQRDATAPSVSFNKTIEIIEVPHMNDMSDDEFYGTWWTPEEFQLIRHMITITLQLMERGHVFSPDDPDFCTCGLEGKQRRATRRRQRRRDMARSSVIQAQRFQFLEGFWDPDYLATVYRVNSQQSCLEARRQGERDRAVAAEAINGV
mmetsp:Transcript_18648/g.53197  ORF Transcript_18648/g.53197 Transcript_18648/m.53197 type:complete len:295 (-) Transcript_18648:304-1188(-)